MNKRAHLSVLIGICFLFLPVSAFGKQNAGLKHLRSVTGSKETGPLGLLGAVFFDEKKDRLYITDSTKDRILAFDSNFKFVSEFTGGGALSSPTSLVRNSLGWFFVAQPETAQVLSIDMTEKRIEPIDFSAVAQGNAVHPGNLAIDGSDRLYVVDRANQRILVFGADLRFEKQISVQKGLCISDVKVDSAGRVYALNTLDGSVHVFDRQGKPVLRFGKKGQEKGEFRFPVSLAVDRRGRVYVVDQHKHKVLVFGNEGEFLFSFSDLGWREGRLHFPSYIFVSNSGRIFIVDRQNARVSVFE